ncbi:MAG: response regulator [Sphingobacteriales bacterium]|nr:response regulator [Sphingobacteriales bacterium]OJW03870.1 MAG: hybrid sensor histidine kinase/response regulator [Sphingobacteriales bacterium 44-61]
MKPHSKQPPKSDIKILVVDDREDNLISIETILERDNYTIVKASSGRAALKILLQQHDFSLILMDVQMPDLNGFETAAIIYERDKLKDIPIIFITAHDYDEEIIFKGYRTGGVDYIYKPINPDLLRVKVGVFVELYRKNYQLLLHEQKLLAANHSLQKEIEERKASEEKVRMLNAQLVENNLQLKEINEELDQFAYVASHDLQEPLRKIQVFSDKILTIQKQDEETEKYFKKIISSSQRMQSLINDLLSFSRHSANSSDFKMVDLNLVVKEALVELEIKIEKSNAVITFDNLPAIYAIPSMVRQLFYNLISNALKFRKADATAEVKISSRKIAGTVPEQALYEIIVADKGIGFEQQFEADIFRVFKRLHSYHDFEGSGIGLSICKKIVDKHNGTIRAESKPGEGASFIIRLPEKQ